MSVRNISICEIFPNSQTNILTCMYIHFHQSKYILPFFFLFSHIKNPEENDDAEPSENEDDSTASVNSCEESDDDNMHVNDYVADDNQDEGSVSEIDGSIIEVDASSEEESEEESEDEYGSDDPIEYLDGTFACIESGDDGEICSSNEEESSYVEDDDGSNLKDPPELLEGGPALKTAESDSESEGEGNSEGETSGSEDDQRGLPWDDIERLRFEDKVDVIQVKLANKPKLLRFHAGRIEEYQAARKIIMEPPHNVMYWKVWSHQDKEHGAQKPAKATKKLARGQQRLVVNNGGNNENSGLRASGKNSELSNCSKRIQSHSILTQLYSLCF